MRGGIPIGALVLATLALPPEAFGASPTGKIVVAVFDVEANGVPLPAEALGRLGAYVASRLAASGVYAVVPREQIKAQLEARRAESYKACYEQSCQIEIGKEVAAQKSLATSLLKLGSSCVATMTLFDLRTAATEKATTAEGGCTEDAMVGSLKAALAELTPGGGPSAQKPPPAGAATAPVPEPSEAPTQVTETPAPPARTGRSGVDLRLRAGIELPLNGVSVAPTTWLGVGFRIGVGTVWLRPDVIVGYSAWLGDSRYDNYALMGGLGLIAPIGPVDLALGAHVGVHDVHAGSYSTVNAAFQEEGALLLRLVGDLRGEGFLQLQQLTGGGALAAEIGVGLDYAF
jgi:hypothetical protein